jgi:hypothetical protein
MYRKAGVDVMMRIFYHFLPNFCEKMAFFSETNVMINFFQKLAAV